MPIEQIFRTDLPLPYHRWSRILRVGQVIRSAWTSVPDVECKSNYLIKGLKVKVLSPESIQVTGQYKNTTYTGQEMNQPYFEEYEFFGVIPYTFISWIIRYREDK